MVKRCVDFHNIDNSEGLVGIYDELNATTHKQKEELPRLAEQSVKVAYALFVSAMCMISLQLLDNSYRKKITKPLYEAWNRWTKTQDPRSSTSTNGDGHHTTPSESGVDDPDYRPSVMTEHGKLLKPRRYNKRLFRLHLFCAGLYLPSRFMEGYSFLLFNMMVAVTPNFFSVLIELHDLRVRRTYLSNKLRFLDEKRTTPTISPIAQATQSSAEEEGVEMTQ